MILKQEFSFIEAALISTSAKTYVMLEYVFVIQKNTKEAKKKIDWIFSNQILLSLKGEKNLAFLRDEEECLN